MKAHIGLFSVLRRGVALLALCIIAAPMQAGAPANDSAETRAAALLKQLSVEEKVGQLSQQFYFGPDSPFGPTASIEEAVARGQLGSLLFATNPAEINRLQHIAVDKSPITFHCSLDST